MTPEIKKILEEIRDSLKSMEQQMTRIEASRSSSTITTQAQPPTSERRQSVKEFLIECSPSGGVQTTLAIAYYIETVQGVTPFNKDDLESGFRAAKEAVPTNINDKVNLCIKNGHLMEAEDKKDSMKAWVVTRSGEQAVEKGFSKEK